MGHSSASWKGETGKELNKKKPQQLRRGRHVIRHHNNGTETTDMRWWDWLLSTGACCSLWHMTTRCFTCNQPSSCRAHTLSLATVQLLREPKAADLCLLCFSLILHLWLTPQRCRAEWFCMHRFTRDVQLFIVTAFLLHLWLWKLNFLFQMRTFSTRRSCFHIRASHNNAFATPLWCTRACILSGQDCHITDINEKWGSLWKLKGQNVFFSMKLNSLIQVTFNGKRHLTKVFKTEHEISFIRKRCDLKHLFWKRGCWH